MRTGWYSAGGTLSGAGELPGVVESDAGNVVATVVSAGDDPLVDTATIAAATTTTPTTADTVFPLSFMTSFRRPWSG